MGWYDYGYYGYRPYVSVAQRRAKAQREMAKLAKKGYVAAPVAIEGRKITTTFWGNAWCQNLEAYSDFSNRLPRGRSYVRNGSVVDLRIEAGAIEARVMGSSLYSVSIKIRPLAKASWAGVKGRCAGQIGSLVELLQGKLSKAVMEVVTCRDGGLFPKPREIEMNCSCPDYAGMCKHIAATLYGVGARLDAQPELLFKLREVDHLELITEAGDVTLADAGKGSSRVTLEADALGDVFGIELEEPAPVPPQRRPAVKGSRAGKSKHPGTASGGRRSVKGSPAKASKASKRSKASRAAKASKAR
jgi:uncharacterized Zn finger protein